MTVINRTATFQSIFDVNSINSLCHWQTSDTFW